MFNLFCYFFRLSCAIFLLTLSLVNLSFAAKDGERGESVLGKRESSPESTPPTKRSKFEEIQLTISFEVTSSRHVILRSDKHEILEKEIEAVRAWTKARGEIPPPAPSLDKSTLAIDIYPFLPQRVRRVYGILNQAPGPNCLNGVLFELKAVSGLRYSDYAEFEEYLSQHFTALSDDEKPAPGDLGVIFEKEHPFHAFIYVSENLAFDKNGTRSSPYGLHILNAMLKTDLTDARHIRYYRSSLFTPTISEELEDIDNAITRFVIGLDEDFFFHDKDLEDLLASDGEKISYPIQLNLIKFIKNYRNLEHCIDDIDIEELNTDGENFLHWAIQEGDQKKVKLLLKKGASVFTKNLDGYDALQLALKYDRLLIGLDIIPYYRNI